MVLVPFTGVDNHRKCVTFEAGLLAKEDVASYEWLLNNFKGANSHVSSYTVTDQDPSMKVAVARVFPTTRHRYCMWHIMTKVGDKVSTDLAKNNEFRCALNGVVWNEQASVEEFEKQWHDVMDKYDLANHKWFQQMYEVREFLIPAYFNDVFMGGLLRTTSRSEAKNSTFRAGTNHQSGLGEFFIHFECVIDKQRHVQAHLNAACDGHVPVLKTPLKLEHQAATAYTITIFYEVQSDIYVGCFDMRIESRRGEGSGLFYEVEDQNGKVCTMKLNTSTGAVDCECQKFMRVGLLCSHAFVVLKDNRIDHIPLQYITAHWTKGAKQEVIFGLPEAGEDDGTSLAAGTSDITKMWMEFNHCAILSSGNSARVTHITQLMKEQNGVFLRESEEQGKQFGKAEVIQEFYGAPGRMSGVVDVHPPAMSKNKGLGKRLKSKKEVRAQQTSKPKRLCRTCKQMGHHDSRNCPKAYEIRVVRF